MDHYFTHTPIHCSDYDSESVVGKIGGFLTSLISSPDRDDKTPEVNSAERDLAKETTEDNKGSDDSTVNVE